MSLVGALSACGGEDSKADGGGGRGNRDSGGSDEEDSGDEPIEDDGGGSVGGTDSGVKNDAGSDSGVKNDASTDGGKSDGGTSSGTTPVLDSAQARQTGRFGSDLRIDVTGTDPDGDAVAVKLSLTTREGAKLKLADTDNDGKPDATEAQFALVAPLDKAEGSKGYFVLPDMFTGQVELASAEVTLVDGAGLASDKQMVAIATQPVLAAAALCDATYVENRCGDGFGCKGNVPTTCQAGEAPKITRAAYLADELGVRVLIEGTDADLDVVKVTLEFLNGAGNPVALDLDGDATTPDVSSLEREVKPVWDTNKFFVPLDQGQVFADSVAKVRVKVTDRGGLASTPLTADKTAAPVKTSGQTCDIRTFDRCATNTVCLATSTGKTYTCTAINTARTRSCTAALVLEPAKGVTSVRGNVVAPSLWDAPAGCVLGDPTGQAETIVKLVLATPATKVTLSTHNAATSFDSTLYAMNKCEDAPVLAWCEDFALDKKSSGAELVLANLAAGSYFVVVESFNVQLAGSTFQLDVKVE